MKEGDRYIEFMNFSDCPDQNEHTIEFYSAKFNLILWECDIFWDDKEVQTQAIGLGNLLIHICQMKCLIKL
jgi:hypothetical protein